MKSTVIPENYSLLSANQLGVIESQCIDPKASILADIARSAGTVYVKRNSAGCYIPYTLEIEQAGDGNIVGGILRGVTVRETVIDVCWLNHTISSYNIELDASQFDAVLELTPHFFQQTVPVMQFLGHVECATLVESTKHIHVHSRWANSKSINELVATGSLSVTVDSDPGYGANERLFTFKCSASAADEWTTNPKLRGWILSLLGHLENIGMIHTRATNACLQQLMHGISTSGMKA